MAIVTSHRVCLGTEHGKNIAPSDYGDGMYAWYTAGTTIPPLPLDKGGEAATRVIHGRIYTVWGLARPWISQPMTTNLTMKNYHTVQLRGPTSLEVYS